MKKRQQETTWLEVVGIVSLYICSAILIFGCIYTVGYIQEAHQQSEEALNKIFVSNLQHTSDVEIIKASLKALCGITKNCVWDSEAADKVK